MPFAGAMRHPGSYRDPDSTVFIAGDRILRGLRPEAARRFAAVQASGLLDALASEGLVVGTRPAEPQSGDALAEFEQVLEHDRIPFVSYPYEWPFALLRSAALLHLDVHLRALERGVTLTDATAYNVQFVGARPTFIDLGSFRPYEEGELWTAHRQFCEQFLAPLLLAGELGVPHHAWLRGAPDGIPVAQIARLLPARRRLSWRHQFHLLLPARAERHAAKREAASVDRIRQARLPREGYRMMLSQLRRWIAALDASHIRGTTWSDYAQTRTYLTDELKAKRALVAEFAAWAKPAMLWDIGCNDGEFAAIALGAGAGRAVGFDADVGALENAAARAQRESLPLLPLFMDAANPTPGAGWRSVEREPLLERGRPDAVMALAFVHHLALGRNVPLEEVVDFLVAMAPRGMLEFVPKSDPTSQRMLALKGDLFAGYEEAAFERALAARARIVRSEAVSATGRRVFWFER